jgi:hypothetical protein
MIGKKKIRRPTMTEKKSKYFKEAHFDRETEKELRIDGLIIRYPKGAANATRNIRRFILDKRRVSQYDPKQYKMPFHRVVRQDIKSYILHNTPMPKTIACGLYIKIPKKGGNYCPTLKAVIRDGVDGTDQLYLEILTGDQRTTYGIFSPCDIIVVCGEAISAAEFVFRWAIREHRKQWDRMIAQRYLEQFPAGPQMPMWMFDIVDVAKHGMTIRCSICLKKIYNPDNASEVVNLKKIPNKCPDCFNKQGHLTPDEIEERWQNRWETYYDDTINDEDGMPEVSDTEGDAGEQTDSP